jgi:hypothetical protein
MLLGSPPSGRDALLVLMAPRSTTPSDCCDLLSLAAEGEVQLTGNITFSAGTGITLTQVGNDIEIAVS